MKTRRFALLIALLAVLSISARPRTKELHGKVIGVTDGDPITVLSKMEEHKIRLSEIDAPEQKQDYGTKSKQALSEKVFGKDVVIRWREKDAYSRILGTVLIERRSINRKMVEEGWAWHYVKYSKSKSLARAERNAKKNNSDYGQATRLSLGIIEHKRSRND